MTRDDIIKLAHETECFDDGHYGSLWMERFERFSALVAAAEREACAEILDRNAQVCTSNSMLRDVLEGNAAAIRARSQA